MSQPGRPKVAAIIQARMGSSRLPGKVMLTAAGKPLLAHVVERVRRAASVDETWVATSTAPADTVISDWCAAAGVPCWRGSEADVLDRYYRTAQAAGAGVVVRVTSDCPLIDPEVIDRVVEAFLEGGCAYAANMLEPRTFPHGLDLQVVSFEALETAWKEAVDPFEREHVVTFIHRRPERFAARGVAQATDRSAMRWTVDHPEDLAFARAVLERLDGVDFRQQDVVDLLAREPQLVDLLGRLSWKAGA